MSEVSDMKLAVDIPDTAFVKDGSKIEEHNDKFHDIEHLSKDIKNKISNAGLSGPTVVDELLKTFLAKKMEDIESEHKKRSKKKSLKDKKDDEDSSKSRKRKHKKKHKHKSSHKKSKSRANSDHDKHSNLDHQSNKDSDCKKKSDHGSNSGTKSSPLLKFDHGSEKDHDKSNAGNKNSQFSTSDHSSYKDHFESDSGSKSSFLSKFDHESEKGHVGSNAANMCDQKQDRRSNDSTDHEQKLTTDSANTESVGISFETGSTEPIQTIDSKINSTNDSCDHKSITETEGKVPTLMDNPKDVEEQVFNNDATILRNVNCDLNSLQSQQENRKPCEVRQNFGDRKESDETRDHLDIELDHMKHLENSEAEAADSSSRVSEVGKEHSDNLDLNLCKGKVHDVDLVRDGNSSADHGNVSADHGNSSADHGNSSADHGNVSADHGNLSTHCGKRSSSKQGSRSVSVDRHEDPDSQSKDRSRKSKDLGSSSKKSGHRTKVLSDRSSEQSHKAEKSKDSEDHGTKSADHGNRPSSRQGSRSTLTEQHKDLDSQSRDHNGKSKDLDSSSKCSSSRTKDQPDRSSEQSNKADKSRTSSDRKRDRSRSVDCGHRSRDGDRISKDHGSHSKNRRSSSMDRHRQSKEREMSSREYDSHSKDHGKRSRDSDGRSKDHRHRSRNRDSQSKDPGHQSRDRDSQSKDLEQQSREQDSRSKNCRARSNGKDLEKTKLTSEKKRERSRSTDHRHNSTDRDSRSKDSFRQSKAHNTKTSDVERDRSRTKKSSSDRQRDRSRSVDRRQKSRDRSRSVDRRQKSRDRSRSVDYRKRSEDRSLRKRSRGDNFSSDASDDTCHLHRLKSNKQKHRKRRGKSVEIVEDDEMESPEASEKLTERLLKRLNTSIKRGQELKVEKDALLEPRVLSEAGTEAPAESGCGDEDKKEEHLTDIEGAPVSLSVAICEGVAMSSTDVVSVSNVSASTPAVSNTDISAANVSVISSVSVPVSVTEAGVRAAAVVPTVTKPSMGKMKKPLMKMGIRLTETSVAIISSGIKMDTERKDATEDRSEENVVRISGSEEKPQTVLVDVCPQDPSGNLSKQPDKNPPSESVSKTKTDKNTDKKDGLSKEVSDSGMTAAPKEKNLESESRKRRRSRSRDRGMKRRRDGRSRDPSPGKRSRLRTKDRIQRSRSHSRSRKSRSRSNDRRRKSRSRSNDRRRKSTSRSKERRRRSRSRSKNRHQDRRHNQTRSTEPEKSQEDLHLKIDKAQLREIAMKNVYGNVQGAVGPVCDLKPDQVVAIKSGGKSVEELTDFCKRIAEREKNQSTGSPSLEEEEKPPSDDEDMPFMANTFKARELTNSIVLNIRNSKPLPVLSSQEKIAKASELRTQFPVSSGTQHRAKEWVPVEKTQPGPTTSIPALPGSVEAAVVEDKVFPDPPAQQIDVGQVVSERISALRKLQSDPNDIQARDIVYKAQQQMQQWAASKQLPGQFVGTTGLNILSQKDIFNHNPRNQAWVKKDTFTKAPPIDSGIGKLLLQRMGWKEGEGLGKNNEGMTQPLLVDIKMDRKGLTTEEENGRKVQHGIVAATPIRFDFSGKHPVSALSEICTKRKWNMPNFVLLEETGPSHSKTFRFKVEVNNVEYVPLTSSSTKKTAKLEAATVCLQELGLLPRS